MRYETCRNGLLGLLQLVLYTVQQLEHTRRLQVKLANTLPHLVEQGAFLLLRSALEEDVVHVPRVPETIGTLQRSIQRSQRRSSRRPEATPWEVSVASSLQSPLEN